MHFRPQFQHAFPPVLEPWHATYAQFSSINLCLMSLRQICCAGWERIVWGLLGMDPGLRISFGPRLPVHSVEASKGSVSFALP